MAHIDRITEDKIKDAANIVSVIGDWVTLRKSGVEYVGLCPFHNDHTPTNFKVNPKSRCTSALLVERVATCSSS